MITISYIDIGVTYFVLGLLIFICLIIKDIIDKGISDIIKHWKIVLLGFMWIVFARPTWIITLIIKSE